MYSLRPKAKLWVVWKCAVIMDYRFVVCHAGRKALGRRLCACFVCALQPFRAHSTRELSFLIRESCASGCRHRKKRTALSVTSLWPSEVSAVRHRVQCSQCGEKRPTPAGFSTTKSEQWQWRHQSWNTSFSTHLNIANGIFYGIHFHNIIIFCTSWGAAKLTSIT